MNEKHLESQHDHVENMSFADDRDEYESILARFDAKRQRKLLRKIDWRLLSVLGIFYLISFMDRSNIGNARLQGLEDDLDLSPAQFNMFCKISISHSLGTPANVLKVPHHFLHTVCSVRSTQQYHAQIYQAVALVAISHGLLGLGVRLPLAVRNIWQLTICLLKNDVHGLGAQLCGNSLSPVLSRCC